MLVWLQGSHSRAPLLLRLRIFIVVTVAVAVFTDLFTYAVIVPILPFALESRVNIHPSDTQKWISIFLAVYGSSLLCAAPICGWMADRLSSRRGLMLFGLIALLSSTAILCVGRSIAVMVIGRVLQGVSAAIVWGAGLALVVDTMGTEDIGLAMGYVGLGMSLALLIAPLVGGIVFERAGYYAVYVVVFSLIGLDVILRVVIVERKIAERWLPPNSQNPARLICVSVEKQPNTSTGSSIVQTEQKRQAKSAEEIVVESADTTSALVTPTTKRMSDKVPAVILLLVSRRLLSALWCCIASTIVFTVMDTILPLFVKNTFHWNSLGTGLIFLPIVFSSLLNPVIGHLCDRYGPRWFATAGCVMACPCLILLRLVHEDTFNQKILLCGLLAVLGICLNLVMTPMMAEISYTVEEKVRRRPPGFYGKHGAYAQGYSLFNIAWSAGGLIGPLLGGMTDESKGWGTTTLLLGCMSIFTAVPAAIWTGGSISQNSHATVNSKTSFDKESASTKASRGHGKC